jgi:hypothetical protein
MSMAWRWDGDGDLDLYKNYRPNTIADADDHLPIQPAGVTGRRPSQRSARTLPEWTNRFEISPQAKCSAGSRIPSYLNDGKGKGLAASFTRGIF